MTVAPLIVKIDLDGPQLPCLAEIREAAEQAVLIERKGAGPGSLTNDGLRYSVVDYEGCKKYAPTLVRWAEQTLPAIVSALTGMALVLLDDPNAAVNINVLGGIGEKYELHTDSVPYTAILFATGPHDGGELMLAPYTDGPSYTEPVPGRLILFEGDRLPHGVLPMKEDESRVSCPISMMEVGARYERPTGVDRHLYASTEAA